MMQIHTRFSGELASTIGKHRYTLNLPPHATVGDLLDLLCQEHPNATGKLKATVQIITGRHVTLTETLSAGQEVAFLLPMAGG
ncbi:MAG: MoaD/ThiS family protein [Anaerolineaceae bacterium]|nr:MoaD/ThiS family protein [Anaerolineaceae bacterium]